MKVCRQIDHSPLRRFVTDGLHDTIACYTAGTLPLHGFAWELDSRLGTLVELTGLPHWRTLSVLRAAQRTIADLDSTLRANAGGASTGEGLTEAEEHTLTAAVTTLRTTLARLDPDDPIDPVDPTSPHPVVLTLVRPADTPRHHHPPRPDRLKRRVASMSGVGVASMTACCEPGQAPAYRCPGFG